MQKSKKCNRCGEVKELHLFPNNSASPDGHYSLCKECRAVAAAARRERPDVKAREKERLAKQYQDNKEELLKKRAIRYRENIDRDKKTCHEWREKNLDRHREMCRNWARNHPENMRAIVAKRRALKLKADGSYTKNDIKKLKTDQKNVCVVCGVDLDVSGFHVDHIYPLSKGGSNWPNNLQLLCPTCNRKKGSKTPDEFRERVYSAVS